MSHQLLNLLIITNILTSLVTSSTHPHGEALSIQKFIKLRTEKGVEDLIFIDYEKLYELLDHDEIQDRKIVAFSIIGAYRKGKSFFLDYCLRFLYANYKSINTLQTFAGPNPDWLGSPSDPLLGFSWKSGSKADTQGILFWSDIFLYDNPENGEKIAIMLMDTQGLFEPGVSSDLNARIFGLSTLISSIQVINLSGVIQEDQLQYLEMSVKFTELIKIKSKKTNLISTSSKPFQNLVLLIRDWVDEDTGYGFKGGEIVWSAIEKSSKKNEKAENVRKNIKNAFEKISTFLLPHPGLNVVKKEFDGSYKELEKEFLTYLKVLIESLLSSENLTIKKVFGSEIKGEDFKNLIFDYFDAFNSTQIPKIESIYRVTVMREMRSVIDSLKVDYMDEVQKILNFELNIDDFKKDFDSNHQKIKEKVVGNFEKFSKVDDSNLLDEMTQILQNELDKFSQKLFLNIQEVYKSFQAKKLEIEALKLQEKEYKTKIIEQRKTFEKQLSENAEKLARLEKQQRELKEKSQRFNFMKILENILQGVITLGKIALTALA